MKHPVTHFLIILALTTAAMFGIFSTPTATSVPAFLFTLIAGKLIGCGCLWAASRLAKRWRRSLITAYHPLLKYF